MQITVKREAEDGLTSQVWTFEIMPDLHQVRVALDSYVERSRASRRHKTWTIEREYLRGSPEGSKNGGRTPPPRVLPANVPLPDDVMTEARETVIRMITFLPIT